jgi:SAM-dependent methyltransferase
MVEREASIERLSTHTVPKTDGTYLTRRFLSRDIAYAAKKFAKGNLLDIGCGNKPYESLFTTYVTKYVGCDIVQSDQSKVDVICEANKIPLSNDQFETIFSTQTIEHVFDHKGLVNEAFRLIKPGGYFILSGPMYWPLHEEPYDFYRFTKHGFRQILVDSGFEISEIKENGGKWALFGQVLIHTFPKVLTGSRPVRYLLNSIFEFLDKRFFDPISTTNYVIIAKKSDGK